MTGPIGRSCWPTAAVILCVALVCLLASASSAPIDFTIDASKPTTPWQHYWKECVGSGHALLALRQDYREHLTMARRDLGLKYVRFHAMFDDDMSALLEYDSNGKAVYSFFNLNSIYDFLLSIGMKPYVELSFMPGPLASNSTYVMRYLGNTSPPKDYNQWSDLVSAYVRQIIDRYGIYEVRTWYFELWNEPDSMWSGTQAEYFKLYNYTSLAIKAIDPLLRVGGPATAQSLWIPQFKSYVLANQLPLDFISTHEYPTDVRPLQRDIMKKVITKTKIEASPFPVIYSEYNSGLFNPYGKHDDPYASAFVMYTIPELQGVIDILSYWAFSDIFEESGFDSTPFHHGYGMLNINKIPKPVYRAFEILHRTGEERLAVSDPRHPTVGTFAILNRYAREVIIIAYNFQVPDHPIQTEVVSISVSGLPFSGDEYATLERIDDSNANAPAAWRALGRPQYPGREQILLMERASLLEKEHINFSANSSGITFAPFYLPALGVAAITLHY